MTGKELMYIEDALGHEQYFQTKCCELQNSLQNGALKNTVAELQNRHRELYNGFLSELN